MTRFSPIRCEQMWPFDSASLTGPIRFGLGLLFCVLFSGIAYSDSPEEASSVAEASRFSPTVRMLRRVRPAIVAILVQRDGKLHSGSGSIIHPAGLVLTNHHVVQGNSGFVLIDGDTVVPFRPIGSDPERDLAVIQIKVPKGKSLTAIDLGTSGNTEMGEEIVNLGNPGGRGVIATRGIISAPNIRAGGLAVAMANNKLDELDRFIQFDAASNPGNSGGAIVNVLGQQIGVVASQIKGEENGNLAIPIDRFHQLLHEMMSVEILRGIQVGLRVKESDGEVDIEAVAKGSPAAAVGLRPGMTIQSWNGKPIRSHIEFQLALLQMDAKKSFEVSVVDDGKTRRFSLSPMVVPPEPPTLPLSTEVDGEKLVHGWKCDVQSFAESVDYPFQTEMKPERQMIVPIPVAKPKGLKYEDRYRLSYEGLLRIRQAGLMRFAIGSDDGSRIYVNDRLVADNDGHHPLRFRGGWTNLSPGWHHIRIEYFEIGGNQNLVLRATNHKHEMVRFTDKDLAHLPDSP